MLDGSLADLAGGDQQQGVDAAERRIERSRSGIVDRLGSNPKNLSLLRSADQGEKIAGRHLLLELVDDNMAQLAGCSRYCDRHGKYLRVESG